MPTPCPPSAARGGFLDRLDRHVENFEPRAARLQQGPLQRQTGWAACWTCIWTDPANASNWPSHYDYTSVRPGDLPLAANAETGPRPRQARAPERLPGRWRPTPPVPAFAGASTPPVGFAVFDRLLISVHPHRLRGARQPTLRGARAASRLADAAIHRRRRPAGGAQPGSPADLMLRMVNAMVDGYLDLRRELTASSTTGRPSCCPRARFNNWSSLLEARAWLHVLDEDLRRPARCLQDWIAAAAGHAGPAQCRRVQLASAGGTCCGAQPRRGAHRGAWCTTCGGWNRAETVVQIHFSAQSNRTNDIMRTLTALTAIFLPLNLIAGIFGMNLSSSPAARQDGFWWAMGSMVAIAVGLGLVFWRKRSLRPGTPGTPARHRPRADNSRQTTRRIRPAWRKKVNLEIAARKNSVGAADDFTLQSRAAHKTPAYRAAIGWAGWGWRGQGFILSSTFNHYTNGAASPSLTITRCTAGGPARAAAKGPRCGAHAPGRR